MGLIVLAVAGTYGVSHLRRHHFQTLTAQGGLVGGGSILIDTETGVECSARFDMKWTDANKKAVWAAGLTAKKAEAAYAAYVSSQHMSMFDQVAAINLIREPAPIPTSSAGLPPLIPAPTKFEYLYSSMEDQDAAYNALVEKANDEKVLDPDSSYFKNFPLCKDVR
jgi:hypothetical protein